MRDQASQFLEEKQLLELQSAARRALLKDLRLAVATTARMALGLVTLMTRAHVANISMRICSCIGKTGCRKS